VVTRRKQGIRSQGSGGPSLSVGYGQRAGNGMKASMALGLADLSSGPSGESKRKLLTQGDINGP